METWNVSVPLDPGLRKAALKSPDSEDDARSKRPKHNRFLSVRGTFT
jgi:hypothetical protein